MRTSSGRIVAATLVFVTTVALLLSSRSQHVQSSIGRFRNTVLGDRLLCKDLAGANDTVVVLKTGTTELEDKLPVHFKTNFRCYPNWMIVSDHAETYRGHEIHDALERVSDYIKDTFEDFAQYRRLQEAGRQGLNASELTGKDSHEINQVDRMHIPAWKLDKWKFLPMMNLTLTLWPDKKWYIFCEADTFLFWKTLLVWLSGLDASEDWVLGSSVAADFTQIAHGGSGFIVSHSALQKVVELWRADKEHWEYVTEHDEIGDGVLAQAFNQAGIVVRDGWPVLQGESVGSVNYQVEFYESRDIPPSQVWCAPTVSYHHINPEAIQTMWEFEQEWLARDGHAENFWVLRHYDVFRNYSFPRIRSGLRGDWDNHCSDSQGFTTDFEECKSICERDSTCLQFSINEELECFTNGIFQLGAQSSDVLSGWMVDRVVEDYDGPETVCHGEGWPRLATPNFDTVDEAREGG